MDQLFFVSLVSGPVFLATALGFDAWAKRRINEDWLRSIVADKGDRMADQRRRSDEARLIRKQTAAIVKQIIKNHRRKKAMVSKS